MEKLVNKDEELDVEDYKFKNLMYIYSLAIKELQKEINLITQGQGVKYTITTRIKTPESIIEKLIKKKCNKTYNEMLKNINDIAGIRIVCLSKDEIFYLKNLIKRIPQIKIIKEKDYITYPKKSGYSSYHLIVQLPIKYMQKDIYVKVEIQIRTVAMDVWASVQHKEKYKPEKIV